MTAKDIENILKNNGFIIAPPERLLPFSAKVKLSRKSYINIGAGFAGVKAFDIALVAKSEEEAESVSDRAVNAIRNAGVILVDADTHFEGRTAVLTVTIKEV